MAYGHGKAFEQMIERTNEKYKRRGIANIEKVPTPTSVNRQGQGYYKDKSIVDFVGFYVLPQKDETEQLRFMPVAFDAKETKDKNKFPLSSIKKHQYEFLKMRHKFGTEAFILINCVRHRKIYRLGFEELHRRWKGWKSKEGVPYDNQNGSYASISFNWMEENLKPINSKNGILVDYLNMA